MTIISGVARSARGALGVVDRLLAWPVRLLLVVYKRVMSPVLPPACRFVPTCSEYGQVAYAERGFLVGSVLTAGRIARCHPWCEGGHDPVPMGGHQS
jgi:uncharacterized protein